MKLQMKRFWKEQVFMENGPFFICLFPSGSGVVSIEWNMSKNEQRHCTFLTFFYIPDIFCVFTEHV